jgi:hypothetical protein
MSMTMDQLIQIGILFVGFAAFMYPLHLKNKARAVEQTAQLRFLIRWSKQHGKKDRKGFEAVTKRLEDMERRRYQREPQSTTQGE